MSKKKSVPVEIVDAKALSGVMRDLSLKLNANQGELATYSEMAERRLRSGLHSGGRATKQQKPLPAQVELRIRKFSQPSASRWASDKDGGEVELPRDHLEMLALLWAISTHFISEHPHERFSFGIFKKKLDWLAQEPDIFTERKRAFLEKLLPAGPRAPARHAVQAHGDPTRFGGKISAGEIEQVSAGQVDLMANSGVEKYVSVFVDQVRRVDRSGTPHTGPFVRISVPPTQPQGSVVVLALLDGQEWWVALARSYRYPMSWMGEEWSWATETLRGFADREDKNAVETATREVSEEAGLLLKDEQLRAQHGSSLELGGFREYKSLGQASTDSGKLTDAPNYHLFMYDAPSTIPAALGVHDPMEQFSDTCDWHHEGDRWSHKPAIGFFPFRLALRACAEDVEYRAQNKKTMKVETRKLRLRCAFDHVALLRALPHLMPERWARLLEG